MTASIGVLITYHNEQRLLQECLESLRAGAMPDEVWIYDDASTERPEPWIPSGFSARVIRGDTNRGPAFGRNRLLEACGCDYVHFHDADDLFDSAWTAVVRETISRTGVDVVWTEIATLMEGRRRTEHVLNLRALAADRDLVKFCLQGPVLVPSGTYRKSIVAAMGGYRETLWQSEDYDFHVRLALRRPSFEIVDQPLIIQRLRAESRSQNVAQVWQSTLQGVTLLSQEIPREHHLRLAEVAASAGSELYRLGLRREARVAFELAQRLGPPTYDKQWGLYRCAARLIGPMAAEGMAVFYRKFLPGAFRDRARRVGDRLGWHAKREGYF